MPNKRDKQEIRCENCIWVDRFKPRPDEIVRGFFMGCKKPGWEGYTYNDAPTCGGVFFKKKVDDDIEEFPGH